MKNLLTHFSKIRGYFSASQSNDVGYDCRLTVVRPSFDCRSTMLKLCSVLAILLTIGVGNAWGTTATWELVESEPADWSGEYLIVYNTGCFDGHLTSSLDQSFPVSVTISNKKITLDDQYSMIVAKYSTKYSLKTKSGRYIGRNNSSAGLNYTTTMGSDYTVSFGSWNSTNKTVKISGNGGYCLGSNSSNSYKWRFFSSSNAFTNVQLFKKAASCDYKVTVTKSDASNGSYTLKAGSASGTTINNGGTVDNCDANATIVVIPSPNSHYHVSGVSASNKTSLSGPDGSGNYTITYTKGSNISTTIGVTFEADPTYTVTWVAGSNPSFSTQTNYAGTALTDPGEPSPASYCPGGKVFVGWTATPIVGEGEEPADLFTSVSGKSIPVGGTTYYAVFATEGEGSDPVTDTEPGKTSTPYVNNTGWTASAGGTYTSSGNYSVSPSIKFNSDGHYVQSPTYSDAITNINFWHKNQGGAGYIKIYVSTNGSSFTELTDERITLTVNQYTVGTKDIDLDYEDGYKAVKIVFSRTSGTCCIDEIAVTYGGGTSYSNYATTCCTNLGSINGSFSWTNPTQVVLTWDNVEHVSSWDVSCIVHGGSTAGSVGSTTTNGAGKKTCTITGLSCNTYYDFTISATAASGYCDKSQTIENENSGTWSVSSSITNGSDKSVPSTACGDYTATYNVTDGYHFPDEITVTGASSYTWDDEEGELTISGANITGDITISITCPQNTCDYYSFHYQHSSDWNTDNICFTPISSGNVNYLTEELSLPLAEWYNVTGTGAGGHGASSAQTYGFTGTTDNVPMPFFHKRDKSFGANPQIGNIGGGLGRFHVYGDSDSKNKYVSFIPTGYTLNFGTGDPWTNDSTLVFTGKTSNWNETEWYTPMVTLKDGTIGKKIFVGLKTSASYVWCDPYSQKVNLSGLRTKTGADSWLDGGLSTSYAEKTGKFRVWATSGDPNWYVTFVPYFRVTYDANTGSGAPSPSDYVSCEGNAAARTIAIPSIEPTKTGHDFMGWATSPERAASGTVDYKYGTANDDIELSGSQTLYAVWQASSYVVTLEATNATSGSDQTVSAIYGSAMPSKTTAVGTPAIAAIARTGYIFTGWWDAASGGTQYYSYNSGTGAISSAHSWDKTSTYTLKAQWTPNTYSVRFNRNGGTGGSDMSNQNFIYDVAQNLSTCTFTHATKSFGGWTTNSDGTGDEYANGASVSNLSSTQGAVVDLYAKWVDCDLYTVTLNVNGNAWKTWTQGSCGASIDLSEYTDVPNCGGGYTLRGWSTTNTAAPIFDAPTITTSSTYAPTANTTLYAVFSHAAVVGTRVMSTASLSEYEYYYVVASGYDKVMAQPTSTTNLAAAIDVAKSADGSKCVVTGSGTPFEIMFTDKSTYWMISKYNTSTGNNWYYYSQGSRNALAWYDEDDYWEWWYEDYIEKYGDWYDAESYVATNTPSSKWSVSIDGSTGVATISEGTNSRTWKYNSSDVKFGAYTSGNKAVSLYQLNESSVIYTTQPDMTYYTITKGVESGGTFNIAEGVACSGHAVDVTATPSSGYAFNGWTSSSGGSFGNASSSTTTFTPTANTTVTANFVAAVAHDITWMVNGAEYTTGTPTSSLTAGTSFSTMTLPTAPANNTLSGACSAVANQFVGWSTTDRGFATGQSSPSVLFTTAAGAGSALGLMGDADVTFYAVFAQDGSSNYMSRCPNTYAVTLDDNGDYGGNGSAVATEMSTSLTSVSAPTRNGYEVEGYYLEPGCSNKVSTPLGALQANKTGWTNGSSQFIGTSDGTLYANWSIINYTITYENLNGATNSNPTSYTITTATIVLADPGSRTGYTFAGWTCGGDAITQIALGSTGDKTITANWTANKYNITYKDKDDAAYSGDKTDGRPTGLPAQHTYGSATELNDGTRTGYRFDGWYTSSNCSTGKVTSLGATDYTSAITLYAKWTASHTYSFSKNGVIDGTLQKGAVEGETVTMPNTTVDCGLWTTFVGWVEGDVAETTTEPATIYRAGDIYEVPLSSGDKTFKAVYSKHEGDASVYYEKETSGPKSGTYVIAADNTHMYIFAGYNANNASSTYGTNATDHTFSGSDNNIITSKGGGVEVSIIKNTSGKFAIKSGSYCAKPSSADLNTQETDASKALVWQLDGSGQIQEKDATTYFLQINTSNKQFKCYAGTQWPAYLYRKKVAGTTYYTTAPASCAVPTQITVSYNDNKSHAGDQTISGMPSGTTLTFTSYPDFASYTVGSAPTDPTGYHFVGWNTQADGNGDDYTAGSSVTTFGYRETITLYAKWERVYTVTLYDNGAIRTELVQASEGAAVDLPAGNNCGVGSPFSFVGWTESSVVLNADPVRPAAATLHATGDYTPEDDITLYSVYSRSVNGCEDFAAGVSGAYKMYNKATSDYALTTGGSSSAYGKGSSGTAEIFYIAYAPAYTAYTIRTSAGYLGWEGTGSSTALTKTNTTPYYWLITEGTSGNAGYWNFQPISESGRQFSGNNTTFQIHTNSTKYYIRLEKVAMTYYYNTAICEGSQITFHDGGGTISGTPTTPTGASWNGTTHVLSGLEDCDKITTFPTASYDGWTFIGWSTEDYSNSGKHTTDHPEENAGTDEPDGSEIYKTDGNPYVVRGGSVDLYPVFTRFPENEPFNTETGGDYYIYYLKPGTDDGYGAPIRVYAGEYDGAQRYSQTTSCAAATEFTFTKSGEVWHIYDKATSKYVVGRSGKDDLQHANDLSGELDDWTITIKSGNQFYASCQGGGRYISFSTSANYFMDYSTIANPGICLPVYLGSCTERIFSSEPNPTPTIDLTGEPIVTSSVGQEVRATATMTLTAAHLTSVPATRVKITGTNLRFATTATATPAANCYVDLVSGNANATLYVYYQPTATEDGIENISVTAQAYNGNSPKDLQTTGVVHARHLPANFVIAAKWGDKWYALPNTCAGEGSNTAGVQIEVDNNDVPTAATSAPNTAKWGLRQTKAGSRLDGSYNDRLVFTERTTAEANSQKTLYNYNQAEIFTSATYTNYNNTNPERYEWIPVTTDFGDYELTSANDANHHLLLRNSDGLFVAQNSDKSYDGKVRLLPATFYEEAPVQILEWKANSIVVMYTGTETSATTQIAGYDATSAQTLASQKLTHGIYELTTNASMNKGSNSCKNLTLTFGSTKKVFEIPFIITSNISTFSGDYSKKDIIITRGCKLTASSTKYSYRNIYIYGGGKLDIPAGGKLGVNNIILRAGGISTNGSGGSATYEYVYPQIKLASTAELSSTKANIKYEYITDYSHWYHLCLPFNGTLNSITYPVEYYGDNVAADNHGSWQIKRYAGEIRATGNYNAWVDIESESATSVTAGHGYIYWGAPKKITIGEDKQRQKWGIQRITMPVTASAAISAENADKTVSGLGSYSGVSGNSGQDNDQGWNLIGDPYLTNLTDMSTSSLHACKLVEVLDANENWTGRWEWNDETSIRYLTIPDHHFDTYEAKTVTAAKPLVAGRTFFVQIAGEATGVTFEYGNRASLLPALYATVNEAVDIETGIVMSDETKKDEVNFWIKEGKTAEYEYNADYPKTPNTSNFNIYGVHSHGDLSWIAISPEIAEGSMAIGYQVPTAGEYTLSLSETYVSDKIDHVLVTDHEVSPEITTDLMDGVYNFQVNQAETNKTRFTVSIVLKDEVPGTTTDIGDLSGDSDKPTKFIYHDKMYILRGGQIYDATGKQVREINK